MIRYFTAGESHGEALVGIVEGLPAGIPLSAAYIDRHLTRRWLGFGRGGRAKIEQDRIQILSGIRHGLTMGSPIALRLENAAYHKDRSGWPTVMAVEPVQEEIEKVTLPRPGHADLVGALKYGFDDIRPVIDRASARETAMRVACASTARCLLEALGIHIVSHVVRIGAVGGEDDPKVERRVEELLAEGPEAFLKKVDASPARMIDDEMTERCIEHIEETRKAGDSLGGMYEVIVTGVPAGIGSYVQWDRKLDGRLAQAIISIQAQKAVEFGRGKLSAAVPGSQFHDEIVSTELRNGRSTNRAGGIEGGMSNGMPIIIRGYMKPIPTLIKPLGTVDLHSGEPQPTRYERSDVTSVPAASTVAEAVVAPVIASAVLEKYGGDSLEELLSRFP